jgi:glycosyltransferase involved in cell wall biosynthesis
MKILGVHPHDPTNPLEPWTVRITSLASELRFRGHEVRLICFRFPGSETVPPPGSLLLSRAPRALARNVRTMRRCAQWADVIHLQKCYGYAAVPALAAAYLRDKPIHYDWDDWEEGIQREHHASPPMLTYVAIAERLLPKLVDTVSVSSEALGRRCEGLGVPGSRIYHVPVGADLELFRPDIEPASLHAKLGLGENVVIYLGQLHGSHDAPLFLRAAKLVVGERPDVTFLVVGEGRGRPHLEKLARQLGAASSIRFVGAVPHDAVPRHLALAKVAVAALGGGEAAASKSPLKLAEYMAAGKAIVSTDVGEAIRMIGGCGTLVPPGDETAMADAVIRYLEDPAARQEHGARARLRAEEIYNWAAGAKTLEAAYCRALGIAVPRGSARG